MPAVEIVKFFLQTGWVAKVVLVILIIFSLASWSVILGKWRELGAARRSSDRFLKVFRDAARLNEAAAAAPKYRSSPLAGMFQAGYTELEAQMRSIRRNAQAEEPRRYQPRPRTRQGGGDREPSASPADARHHRQRDSLYRSLRHRLGNHEYVSCDWCHRFDLDRYRRTGNRGGPGEHGSRSFGRDPRGDCLQPSPGKGPHHATQDGGLSTRVPESG